VIDYNIEGIDTLIWSELQRQLDKKGFKVEKGTIQDAAFIEAGLGKKRYSKEKKKHGKMEKLYVTLRSKNNIWIRMAVSV